MNRKITKEESLAINREVNDIYGIAGVIGEQGDIYAPSHSNTLQEKDLMVIADDPIKYSGETPNA